MQFRRHMPPLRDWKVPEVTRRRATRWGVWGIGAVLAGYLTAYLLIFPTPILHGRHPSGLSQQAAGPSRSRGPVRRITIQPFHKALRRAHFARGPSRVPVPIGGEQVVAAVVGVVDAGGAAGFGLPVAEGLVAGGAGESAGGR